MSEIIKGLFLGNAADSESVGTYADVVVNCTNDLPFFGCSTTQAQYRIPAEDNGDPRQQSVFQAHAPEVLDAVAERIASDRDSSRMRVLVHCAAGRQRSAAFVAALLLKLRVCSNVDDAVEFVKAKKPDAFFGGVNFKTYLDGCHCSSSSFMELPLLCVVHGSSNEDAVARRSPR